MEARGAVRYTQAQTTVGPLWVAFSPDGVCLTLLRASETEFVEHCRQRLGCEPTREPDPPPELHASIQARLAGEGSISFNLSGRTTFQRAVLELVAAIPRGEVRSYREVAEQIGRPGAARAVGEVMRTNPIPVLIPCHRVVRSDGSIGRYTPEPSIKRRLLEEEGVVEPDSDVLAADTRAHAQ